MSDNLNRDFSKYETMETDELEEILRLDAETPEGVETDTELVLFILEVLAKRKNTTNLTGNTAQKAWESFEQNYMPEKSRKSATTNRTTPWLRRLTAAAAAVALLIVIPITTKALTLEEVWNIFARWAKETFSFVSGDNTEVSEPVVDDGLEYDSIQDILKKNGKQFYSVPTWIPDGFALETIKRDVTPAQETYLARYINGDKKFSIRVQNYLGEDFQKVEIEEDYSEIYPSAGVDYYLFENVDQCSAFWVIGTYECIISGDLSIEELKLMIDSIEKG
jgi:hypothetical protein